MILQPFQLMEQRAGDRNSVAGEMVTQAFTNIIAPTMPLPPKRAKP